METSHIESLQEVDQHGPCQEQAVCPEQKTDNALPHIQNAGHANLSDPVLHRGLGRARFDGSHRFTGWGQPLGQWLPLQPVPVPPVRAVPPGEEAV